MAKRTIAFHRERFAPSPTGPLHLGHAFSALTAWDRAMAAGGAFLLRIEDIDQSRARVEWEQQIYDDLHWLGLRWPGPVLRQSDRHSAYVAALRALWDRGLLYPCTCTRRDIETAASAPQEGGLSYGPDGLIYPGTCRNAPEGRSKMPSDTALRLNMRKAIATLDAPYLQYSETGPAEAGRHEFNAMDLIDDAGDIVLARKDMGTSYHLSVIVDDAFQNITHVTRGHDLFAATRIHVLLQHLLAVPTPSYHHHALIRDDAGKRLAKRDDARAIAKYRDEGATPADIRAMVGL